MREAQIVQIQDADSEFRIERGVPLPADRGRPKKYPFAQMEVGDSFFLPGKQRRTISSSASSAGRRLNRKFATRKVDGGMRVWRVE